MDQNTQILSFIQRHIMIDKKEYLEISHDWITCESLIRNYEYNKNNHNLNTHIDDNSSIEIYNNKHINDMTNKILKYIDDNMEEFKEDVILYFGIIKNVPEYNFCEYYQSISRLSTSLTFEASESRNYNKNDNYKTIIFQVKKGVKFFAPYCEFFKNEKQIILQNNLKIEKLDDNYNDQYYIIYPCSM